MYLKEEKKKRKQTKKAEKEYHCHWHFEKPFLADSNERGVRDDGVYALLIYLNVLVNFSCIW